MRTLTALTLALVAATAGSAGAAPARGVTFTDPAGDANALDGASGTGSQAALDVVKVTLLPFERTRTSSGITVQVELAAAPLTAPGTSYVLTATQQGCTMTISRTITAEGVSGNRLTMCGTGMGGYVHNSGGTITTNGKRIVFTVSPYELWNSSLGAVLTNIEVSTSAGDPAVGAPAPQRVDRAVTAKPYRLGA